MLERIVLTAALTMGAWSHASAQSLTARYFSPSVPTETQKEIAADFEFLKTMKGQGASPFFRKVYGSDLDGSSLSGFVLKRIKRFDMHDCGGGGAAMACVRPDVSTDTMWITRNYLTFNMPQIARLAVLFHESRHTEPQGDFWMHQRCPVPFLVDGKDYRGPVSGQKLEGQYACDSSIWGAYGIHGLLLKNVELHCESCGEKVKMDAKIFADDAINRISNIAQKKKLLEDLSGGK